MTSGIPVAKWQGSLKIGGKEYECYVLNSGARVLSLRGTMLALTGDERLNARSFLGSKALRSLISNDFLARKSVSFWIPQKNTEAIGLDSGGFIDVCQALVSAAANGSLSGEVQQRAAITAAIILGASSKVGIAALIDEATGHQSARPADALQVLLAAYLSEAEREWAKTFPDDYLHELQRLAGPRVSAKNRMFGKITKHQVYGTLEPEVMRWLAENRPNPSRGRNWHQSLSEFGSKKLREHIHQIIGIAKACYSLREFRERVAEAFGHKPVQKRLPLSVRRAA